MSSSASTRWKGRNCWTAATGSRPWMSGRRGGKQTKKGWLALLGIAGTRKIAKRLAQYDPPILPSQHWKKQGRREAAGFVSTPTLCDTIRIATRGKGADAHEAVSTTRCLGTTGGLPAWWRKRTPATDNWRHWFAPTWWRPSQPRKVNWVRYMLEPHSGGWWAQHWWCTTMKTWETRWNRHSSRLWSQPGSIHWDTPCKLWWKEDPTRRDCSWTTPTDSANPPRNTAYKYCNGKRHIFWRTKHGGSRNQGEPSPGTKRAKWSSLWSHLALTRETQTRWPSQPPSPIGEMREKHSWMKGRQSQWRHASVTWTIWHWQHRWMRQRRRETSRWKDWARFAFASTCPTHSPRTRPKGWRTGGDLAGKARRTPHSGTSVLHRQKRKGLWIRRSEPSVPGGRSLDHDSVREPLSGQDLGADWKAAHESTSGATGLTSSERYATALCVGESCTSPEAAPPRGDDARSRRDRQESGESHREN